MRLFDLCVAKKLSGSGGGGNSRFAELVQRTITTASDSNATSIGGYAFTDCTNLSNVNFPNATSIGQNAFSNCADLVSVDFPSITSIGTNAFYGCTKLSTLVLHKRAVLSSTNAIPSQTIVYVENADLDWYRTAGRWSTIFASGRIKSIDELPE